MRSFFLSYFLIINLTTFVVRGVDKRKAVMNEWRIPEKVLLILTGLGGFLGAIVGTQLFRHKTIKGNFLLWFNWIVVAWLIVVGLLIYYVQ